MIRATFSPASPTSRFCSSRSMSRIDAAARPSVTARTARSTDGERAGSRLIAGLDRLVDGAQRIFVHGLFRFGMGRCAPRQEQPSGDRKMRIRTLTAVATTMLVSLTVSLAPAFAKTAKECRKEWQADKAAMQAAGKTEKAYVAECA